MKLSVYFGKSLVGQIGRHWDFHYTEEWLEQPAAFAISFSLPLQKDGSPRKQSRNFFANLLPEATLRENICQAHRINYEDDFALLELVGGEGAGALRIISESNEIPTGSGSYEEVAIESLCDRLRARPSMPLAEFAADLRMSLAGAQDKLPVLYKDGRFFLPRDGAASSHILKPANARFADSVINEAFSMELAKRLGFIVPHVRIIPSDPSLFLIERYDRKFLPDGVTVQRLHQEDFCQALGISHRKKYESDGGPGFAKCSEVLERTASPGLNRIRLARWGIFNALIGNADAHGKNLALLHGESRVPDMAPIYDLLSTAVYPEPSSKMAMHIGGERLLDRIHGSQWERYSKDVNLNKRRTFAEIEAMSHEIIEQTERLADEMEREQGRSGFYSKVLPIIKKNCAKVKNAMIDSRESRVANKFAETSASVDKKPLNRGRKM